MNETEPKSPCISVCVLDANDICEGCYRSATEITDWVMSSPEQKREIIRRCRQRMKDSYSIRLT